MSQADAALDVRLARHEARDAIWALIMEFRRNIDARDFAGVARLFCRQGLMESVLGPPARGPQEIERLLERSLERTTEQTRTFHQVSNPVIIVEAENHGRAESTWCYFDRGASGEPVPAAAGRYTDEFTQEAGQWRFLRRRIDIDMPYTPLGFGGTRHD